MANLSMAFASLHDASKYFKAFSREDLRNEGSYPDWHKFLIHIELVWKRAAAGCKDIKGHKEYESIHNKFSSIIKEDELLQYIHYSRNIVEHGTDLLLKVKIIGKVPLFYKKMIHTDAETNVTTSKFYPFFESRLMVTPFQALVNVNGKKKGELKWIATPNRHMGKILNNGDDPIEIGLRAIAFYFQYLFELDKVIFNSKYKSGYSQFWIALNIYDILKFRKGLAHTEFIPVKEGDIVEFDNRPYYPLIVPKDLNIKLYKAPLNNVPMDRG